MQLSSVPLLSRLASVRMSDTRVYRKGAEFVADLQDKYETSDHPAVHKVEEIKVLKGGGGRGGGNGG